MAIGKGKMFVCLGVMVPLFAGCVRWSGSTEYFLGPVLYRYITPVDGKAYVGQVVRLGPWIETGANWGLTLGVSDRITVDPKVASVKRGTLVSRNRWLAALSFSPAQIAGAWRCSPLYLRIDRDAQDYFISRTMAGGEITFGKEANAFTVGYARTTLFTPPADALAKLHFKDNRPLEAEASVWFDVTEPGDLSESLIQEATQ